ncbi:membrane protein [Marinithermofilum abyssi]|uniref:Membrane protein n=1 Tax=Marinithermofilum abyssi TaxID=1571185 RepID=A0A8J2VFY2_9BACL|nr:DUF2232 domain-containing protein [Marinithermofilum abyssi]GGE05925.1 membrane protein [Marinithermofilum abyssi]
MSRSSLIRDGLIYSSLFLVLLFSLGTPLSLVTVWFLPLPFLLFTARQGWQSALLFVVLLSGLIVVLTGSVYTPLILLVTTIAGLVMGELYRRPQTTGTDVVLGGLVTTWVGFLTMLAVGAVFFHLFDRVQSLWQEQWAASQELFRAYGMPEELPDMPPLGMVIPGLLVFASVPIPLLNIRVARRILMRGGFPGKYLPPFRTWRLPRPFFHIYFLALILLLLFGESPGSFPVVLGNAVSIFYLLLMVQGFSFAAFLLHRSGRGKGWMTVVVLGTLLFPPAALIIHVMGLIDTGTPLRDRLEKKR